MTACDFVSTLKTTLRGRGVTVGTYSSEYEWGATVGADCTSLSDTDIWYAHYDGVSGASTHASPQAIATHRAHRSHLSGVQSTGFGDWVPFGGWHAPTAKQYSGTGSVCGFSADLDYMP